MDTESLRKRATKSVGYLIALVFIQNVIKLFNIAILARLLSPIDFGIIALATILSKGLQIFTSFGTEKYLIQMDTITDDLIGNAWTFNIIKGLAVCFFIMAMAPYYAIIIGEPRTELVIYIIALSPLLDGMITPGKYIAERELKFRRVSIFELVITSLGTIILISLAYSFGDVRALAWGLVATSLLRLLLSFVFFPTPYLPKFHLTIFKELTSVGKHFFIIAIGGFIMTQADNLIVGLVMGSSMLGIYVVAYRLIEVPLGILRQIINRIAFPVFSRVQSEKKRLSSAMDSVLQLQLAILIPGIVVLVILAKPIILTIYGEKWLAAVPVLQALTLVLLGRGISHVAVPYIIGTGNFAFASRIKIVETVIFVIAVYLGAYSFGAVGAAIGAGLGYSVAAGMRISFLCKHIGIPFIHFVKQLSKPVICMIPGVIASVCILGKYNFEPLLQLIVLSGLLGAMYVSSSIFFQKDLVCLIKNNLTNVRT